MLKQWIFLLAGIASASISFGQVQFHTPAEILTLISTSKLHYEVGVEVLPKAVSTNRLVFRDILYVDSTNREAWEVKNSNSEQLPVVKQLLDKSMSYRNLPRPDFKKALATVKEAIQKQRNHAELYDFYAQYAEEARDIASASAYYQKAIAVNPTDYFAHWKLAVILSDSGQLENAFDHIFLAHLYNRNHEGINKQLQKTAALNGKQPANWAFLPVYQITDKADNYISIQADAIWLTYALYKAVWKYEPGYKAELFKLYGAGDVLEEMESLLGLYTTYFGMNKPKKDAAISAIGDAIENNLLEEYAYYEVLLPRQPELAYKLSSDFKKRLKRYYLTIH